MFSSLLAATMWPIVDLDIRRRAVGREWEPIGIR
jgi:hypothetical protein